MTFLKTVSGSVLAGILATAAISGPALEIPQCSSSGDHGADLYARNGSVIIFYESDGEVYPVWVVLADCQTRHAVAYKDRGRTINTDAKTKADDLMLDAVKGNSPVSASEMRTQLRKLGLRAKSYSLTPGHCACNLDFDEDNSSMNAAFFN